MFKLFFITFYIAELIIVFAVILKICAVDKKVREINDLVLANQNKIKTGMVGIRSLIENSAKSLINVKEIIKKKRQEYIVNFVKTISVYMAIFMLKGKYKKAFIAYQFAKEVVDGVLESQA